MLAFTQQPTGGWLVVVLLTVVAAGSAVAADGPPPLPPLPPLASATPPQSALIIQASEKGRVHCGAAPVTMPPCPLTYTKEGWQAVCWGAHSHVLSRHGWKVVSSTWYQKTTLPPHPLAFLRLAPPDNGERGMQAGAGNVSQYDLSGQSYRFTVLPGQVGDRVFDEVVTNPVTMHKTQKTIVTKCLADNCLLFSRVF
jgi:hypothetical protein